MSSTAPPPHYNLGARKLRDHLAGQGHHVAYHDGDPGLFAYGYDLVCLSIIFSWHALIARDIANLGRCEAFFAGVALMENFDIKTRGSHQGTNAMQRAAINLEDLGATDFFSAVGLPKPQISLAYITD